MSLCYSAPATVTNYHGLDGLKDTHLFLTAGGQEVQDQGGSNLALGERGPSSWLVGS